MAKRGRRKKGGVIPSLHLKSSTIQSIFFIFFSILCILSIFSFLQTGTILTKYNENLSQYFGFGSVAIPFLLLLISFLFAKIKTPLKELNIFLGFVIMFISAISLFKQGFTGKFFLLQIQTLFGFIPSYLIFSFLLVAGFVILFDTSVAQIVKFIIWILIGLKKYTIGNISKSRGKKAKESKETLYIQSETHSTNVPPIFKTAPSMPILTSPKTANSSGNPIWEKPSISLFDGTPGAKADRGDVRKNADTIEKTLDSFGISARVAEVNDSPSVTQYALEVAMGTKLAKIVNLSNDLAMALAAPGGQIRVEAPIPGRSLVGIEVPNRSLEVVPLRRILESDIMKQSKSKITVPLGLDVAGKPKIADISKMPHVLIAGQTGSGKSICINSWICSLLFRASPDEVQLIMVDPKRVELTPYNGIPHLISPVIVDPEKVVSALKWAVTEMEKRYKLFTEMGAKNIEGYNNLSGLQLLPYIVILIDELAEIMMFSPTEVEENVCRLAQMARAVGIHLVLATQRPSVNVITGLIKANIPTRMAFAVSSMMDSRVILDTPGAEKLLGRGDMLYIPPELAKPVRIQGCFVSDKEINSIINFWKSQKTAEYNSDVVSQPVNHPNSSSKNLVSVGGEERDMVFNEAVKVITETGIASSSFLQRRLKLGYARAARVLDQLQVAGIVGPGKGAKPRDILIPHAVPIDDHM